MSSMQYVLLYDNGLRGMQVSITDGVKVSFNLVQNSPKVQTTIQTEIRAMFPTDKDKSLRRSMAGNNVHRFIGLFRAYNLLVRYLVSYRYPWETQQNVSEPLQMVKNISWWSESRYCRWVEAQINSGCKYSCKVQALKPEHPMVRWEMLEAWGLSAAWARG